MASAVRLREGYSASELRRLAATTRNANQSRRLLSLAAVVDGMNRTQPQTEPAEHRAPGRQIGGQEPPCDPAAQDVEDRICGRPLRRKRNLRNGSSA